MLVGRKILIWIGRHLLALVLILIILIIGRYAFEPMTVWLRAQIEESQVGSPPKPGPCRGARGLRAIFARRQAQVEQSMRALARSPEAAATAAGADRRCHFPRAGGEAEWGAARFGRRSGDSGRIFAHYRAGTEIALLNRERAYIDALLAISPGGGRAGLEQRRRQAVDQLRASYRTWQAASERVRALNQRLMAGPRNLLCRNTRPVIGCDNFRAMAAARAERTPPWPRTKRRGRRSGTSTGRGRAAQRGARRVLGHLHYLGGAAAGTRSAIAAVGPGGRQQLASLDRQARARDPADGSPHPRDRHLGPCHDQGPDVLRGRASRGPPTPDPPSAFGSGRGVGPGLSFGGVPARPRSTRAWRCWSCRRPCRVRRTRPPRRRNGCLTGRCR